jgi:hypothetical protein
MTTHIMLDLETLGVGTMPAIATIGAVRFDPYGETVAEPGKCFPADGKDIECFYVAVDVGSCVLNGGTVDSSAVSWWMQPEQEAARKEAFLNPTTLAIGAALSSFGWWAVLYDDPIIWSHGLLFDAAIVQRWCERLGLHWPFYYRNSRDTRTLFDVAGMGKAELDALPFKPQLQHHAAWDAWWQARGVQHAYAVLRAMMKDDGA